MTKEEQIEKLKEKGLSNLEIAQVFGDADLLEKLNQADEKWIMEHVQAQ